MPSLPRRGPTYSVDDELPPLRSRAGLHRSAANRTIYPSTSAAIATYVCLRTAPRTPIYYVELATYANLYGYLCMPFSGVKER